MAAARHPPEDERQLPCGHVPRCRVVSFWGRAEAWERPGLHHTPEASTGFAARQVSSRRDVVGSYGKKGTPS